MAKAKEDKINIKQFREGSSDFWVGNCHYNLNKDNEIVWCSGGIDSEELRTVLLSFIRRNKKIYIKRSPSIFDSEPREWSELTFGKFKGQRLDVIKDTEPKYLKWLILNSADKKLTEEIKELLKIK